MTITLLYFYHCWASSEAATLVVATDVVYVLLYGVYMLDVRIRVVLRWKRKLLCVKREMWRFFFCRVTMANDKDVWIFYKSLKWWECFETFYDFFVKKWLKSDRISHLYQFLLLFISLFWKIKWKFDKKMLSSVRCALRNWISFTQKISFSHPTHHIVDDDESEG